MYPDFILSKNIDEIAVTKEGVPFSQGDMIVIIEKLIKLAQAANLNNSGLQFLGD